MNYFKKLGPKKCRRISLALVWIGVILVIAGALVGKELGTNFILWIGLGFFVVGVVFGGVTVRCPQCGEMLVGHRPFPKVCPNCEWKIK